MGRQQDERTYGRQPTTHTGKAHLFESEDLHSSSFLQTEVSGSGSC